MTNELSLGQRIRSLRTKKGMTQMELAAGICTPSMISQVETDKANPSYKMLLKIAERLDTPVELLLDSNNVGMQVRSNFTYAQTLMEGQQYKFASKILKKLMESDRPELPRDEIQLHFAICLRNMDQIEEAEQILSTLAEEVVFDAHLHGQVLMELSQTLQAKQEYQIASYHLLKALDVLQDAQPKDPELYIRAVHQLAALYQLQGKGGQAVELYRELVEKYAELIDPKRMAQIYLKIAASYLNQGDFARSQEYASQAHTIFREMGNWARKADAELQIALIEWQQGTGRNTLDKLIDIAATYVTQSEHEKAGAVYAEIAGICLKEGKRKEALEYAEEARKLLSNEHPSKGKVYRTLAALLLGQDEDKGYCYLLNAAVHFEHHRQFQELEEATHAICSYLIEHNRDPEAIERLQTHHAFVMKNMAERGIIL
jgi:HTH-type transcriptional regulator, quorum sensing regulator NprR